MDSAETVSRAQALCLEVAVVPLVFVARKCFIYLLLA